MILSKEMSLRIMKLNKLMRMMFQQTSLQSRQIRTMTIKIFNLKKFLNAITISTWPRPAIFLLMTLITMK